MNHELNRIKLEILKRFPTQGDFAVASNSSESCVSRILKGRKKLSQDEAQTWSKVLDCDLAILEPVTKSG